MKLRMGCVLVGFLSLVLSMAAQTSGSPASAQVPPLIQFSSVATDQGGSSLSGVVSITFSLYTGQQGGEALWTETQNNVQLDPTGHYSAQLGVTKPNGVPTALFTSGEAHWLGVQIAEQAEQPRVLLLSVPYALKAGDATTIGGLPPSAFVLAAPLSGAMASVPTTFAGSATSPPDAPPAGSVTGSGTTNFVPLWTSASNIGNSVLFQSGTGSTAKLGINTSTPATTLDVKGASTIRGLLNLPATGAATATAGKNSQPLDLVASAFNSGTSNAVSQTFRWQGEPAGNDTSSPTGTLNLLFAEGTSSFAETGLNIAGNGQITFATGQTLPNVSGNETVSGNMSASQLISTVANGTAPLQVTSTTQVPNLNASLLGGLSAGAFAQTAAANTFTQTQSISGSPAVSATAFCPNFSACNPAVSAQGAFVEFAPGGVGISAIGGEGDGAPSGAGVNAVGGYNLGVGGPGIIANGGASGLSNGGTGIVVTGGPATNGDFGNTGGTAIIATGGTSAASALGGGVAIIGNNTSTTQTLQLENFAAASNSNFTEAQFNTTKATFFTDTKGDTTATGTKSAAVPLQDGKMVKVFSMESPEVWFEDFGSGSLTVGSTIISLDSMFVQTVNLAMGYHVFLTPKGDCKGLFVSGETNQGFEVRELSGGKSNVEFDYRIVAHRNGYEAERLPAAIMPVAAKLSPEGTVINKKRK